MKRIFLVCISLLCIGGFVFFFRNTPSPSTAFETRSITINGQAFFVEIADTPNKQAQGLQYRTELASNRGMLFVFSTAQRPTFWMKNTLIPLDIVWIRDGVIQEMTLNVQPEPDTPDDQLTRYQPSQPIDQVLELPAGAIAQYAINAGDTIQ